MLAGYDEREGKVVDGKIQFYGMSPDAYGKHGAPKMDIEVQKVK